MIFVGMQVVRKSLLYVVGAAMVQSTRKHKQSSICISCLAGFVGSLFSVVLTYKLLFKMFLNTLLLPISYCMREMLQKVPEGDWLCEECKFAEESENQKQGKA